MRWSGRRSASTRKPCKTTTPRSSTEEAAAELGYDGLTAPLTFICVFGYKAQSAFFENANIAMQDAQIVQVDQVLKFLKPIVAGDKLYCDVWVDSVRRRTAPTSS